jgi:hypothetical protein
MRYIDKRADEEEGNLITDGYLENECKTTDQLTSEVRYQNIDYAGSFSTGDTRNRCWNWGWFRNRDIVATVCGKSAKANLQPWSTSFLKEQIPPKAMTGLRSCPTGRLCLLRNLLRQKIKQNRRIRIR